MNHFRIHYSNDTSTTTPANGTLEEFTAYLMQFGGTVTDEDPATGKETTKKIILVEQIEPTVNYQVNAWGHYKNCPVCVGTCKCP